jgi:hypothetical protein
MNDDAMKWITELEKAARIRTPVGATYAVALALMQVAAQLEKIAANTEMALMQVAAQLEKIAANTERPKGPMLYGEESKGRK